MFAFWWTRKSQETADAEYTHSGKGAFDDLKCNIIILDEDIGRLEIPSPEVAENISRWGTVKQGHSKASDETVPWARLSTTTACYDTIYAMLCEFNKNLQYCDDVSVTKPEGYEALRWFP